MRTFVQVVIAALSFAFGLLSIVPPPPPLIGTPSANLESLLLTDTVQVPLSLIVPPALPRKEVALTFDACPHPGAAGVDQRILEILADSSVAATFFISGQWAEQHPAVTRSIAENPLFEVGNHSFSHPHLSEKPERVIREELVSTERSFDRLAIPHVKLFRPPFGETSDRVQRMADSLGFRTIMYDVASGDPDTSFSRERLTRSVLDSVKDGSVVVLHVNGRGWHTAEALPEIIGELRRRGFVFRTVGMMQKGTGGGAPGTER